DLAVAGEADDAGVYLSAPGDIPASGIDGMRDSGKPDRCGDVLDEPGQDLRGDRWRRRDGAFRVDGVDAVEAEDGVEVDQSAALETSEETGIICEVTGLVGIYTNPHHVIRYTSNDEVRQEFSIVFTARPVGGELQPSSESSEPQWVPLASVANLPM